MLATKRITKQMSMLGRGALAGLVGGLALAFILGLWSLAFGAELGDAINAALAALTAHRAFGMSGPLVFFFIHCAVSALWGGLFGLVFYGLDRGQTFGAGLLWGLLAWIAMYYVVVPLFGLTSLTSLAPPAISVIEHLVFGATTALVFSSIQRDFGRRHWDRSFSRLWDADPGPPKTK